jgi:hypothetical protein
METIRSSTLAILDAFRNAGGTVIVAGNPPEYIDAKYEIRSTQYEHIAFTKDAVLAAVPQPLATVSAPDIFGQLRKTEDGLIFAALNVNRDERRDNATVLIKTDLPIMEWNCETGEISRVQTQPASNGWKIFTTDFPKGGNKLWVASANADATSSSRSVLSGQRSEDPAPTNGPFAYSLSEPNVCVLDSAEYKLDGGDWRPETDVLKIDQKIRDAHGVMRRGGQMLQPWFSAQHPVKKLCKVELRFSFSIEAMPEWIDLVVEEPGNFTVEINGHPLNGSDSESWIDIAFHRIRIPAKFPVIGKNEITLKTLYRENSNLEAIYLLGDFGVQLAGTVRKIVPIIEKVEIGDICPQGFPFYSGAITYRLPLPDGATRLRLPSFGGACAKVNGQILGWDPFEADVSGCGRTVDVELILTRRNTFGPLHDVVKGRINTIPDHWRTEGADFSPEPCFIPAGLLAMPQMLC